MGKSGKREKVFLPFADINSRASLLFWGELREQPVLKECVVGSMFLTLMWIYIYIIQTGILGNLFNLYMYIYFMSFTLNTHSLLSWNTHYLRDTKGNFIYVSVLRICLIVGVSNQERREGVLWALFCAKKQSNASSDIKFPREKNMSIWHLGIYNIFQELATSTFFKLGSTKKITQWRTWTH